MQNILALNPKIKPFASLVPSAETKKIKKHWKRNEDKNCQVQEFDCYINSFILTVMSFSTSTHNRTS